MPTIVILLATVSLAATIICAFTPHRVAAAVTVIAGLGSFGLAIACVPYAATHQAMTIGFLRVDALSVVFLLATGFLYAACAVYSVGYVADERREAHEAGRAKAAGFARYQRRFFVGINAFCWAMLCAPLASSLVLLWVAIELTTIVSALLVAIADSDGAVEAAWKYVLIASSGLGIALLATIVMYYAAATGTGTTLDIGPLLSGASSLPAAPVRLAFVLAVVGFGTKVGLVPMHTWLPDAHGEAPTPVSALLSGSLLADAFYAILRYFQVTSAAVGPQFPRTVLLVFGVASLLLAALSVLEQRNIKRMLAYSSIEHMGILAIGVSFGAKLALVGVLLHVLAHAAAKGNAFLAAGVFVRKYGTKQLSRIRDGLGTLPWSAPMFVMAIFALSAIPPFAIFRSEFDIVSGGLADSHDVGAAILIGLVTLAFAGLAWSTTRIVFLPPGRYRGRYDAAPGGAHTDACPRALHSDTGGPAPGAASATKTASPKAISRGEPSVWMVVPVVAGVIALVWLGVAPPAHLLELFTHAAAELQGVIS